MAKNTGLILAGLALAGFGIYEYMKKRGQLVSVTTVTTSDPTATQLPYTTTTVPSSGAADPIVIRDSGPTTSAGRPFDPSSGRPVSNTGDSSGTSVSVGTDNTSISPAVSAAVMSWVNADGRPPIVAMGQARIPSEFNGMYGIIQGGWDPTSDQRLFWNQLIAKYDPQHKYL